MDLRIHFMSGDAHLHDRVVDAAIAWTRHANIHFLFGAGADAEIRIAFEPNGSWSYIGTEALRVPKEKPTMNLGWLNAETTNQEVRRVVLHEFGHLLGCLHEHQNPSGGIPWDREAVYRYYGGPPNNWDQAKIDRNIFDTYRDDLTSHTKVDSQSIMMYPIPAAFTTSGYSVGLNDDLSEVDKTFIAEMYLF